MRKLSFVLLLFGIFIAEVVRAQDTSTVFPETRQLIQNQLDLAFGSRYELGIAVSVDSLKNQDATPDRIFEDTFGTLQHCIIFTAKSKKIMLQHAGLVGIFKGSGILWKSDTVINTDIVFDNEIVSTQDLNKDGQIDIITSWIDPQPYGNSNEQWWIVSWDGQTGSFLNTYEEDISSLESIEGGFQLIDFNGDGIKEIVGEWVDNPQSETTVNLTYSWNGQKYGKWSNPPQPLPGTSAPRDKIIVVSHSLVNKIQDFYKYSFNYENNIGSIQQIDNIRIICQTDSVFNIINRSKWESYFKKNSFIDWSNLFTHPNFIKQGERDSNFSFSSIALPSIMKCFIRGYNGASYKGDHSTNSFQTLVVGPTNPPIPFVPLNFLDTLSGYTTQSRTLGWIKDQATANKYTNFFATAKAQLTANKIDSVKLTLQTVISSTITDSTSLLTSEAYALLRFNTEYLLDYVKHIPQNFNAVFTSSRIASLSWTASSEPDMPPNGGGYEVYRALSYEGITPSYTKLNTALLTTAAYVDTISIPAEIPAEKNVYVNYYIQAVNNTASIHAQSAVCSLFIGKTTSGSISSNTTWNENKILVGDVTVNSGKTLTIAGGKTILVASGKSLIVNGTLITNSSLSNKITFDRCGTSGTWSEILFNAGSSGSVQYCNIYYANTGIHFNGTSLPDIGYNTISNCSSNGINLYNASPRIHHNIISSNGPYGIACYSSSPKLDHNTITGHTTIGLSCSNYSSPLLGETPYTYYPGPGHNVIKQNNIGISASVSSNPLLGQGSVAGQNCVHDNTGYEMTAGYVSGTIWAEKTWWNRSSPYYNASDFQQYQAFIDYIPAYQSSDPNGCLPLQPNIIQSGKSTTNSISTQVVGDATGDEELKNLLLSELRGKYDETITAYSQRYTRETNKVTKKYILARLAECYRKGEKKNFTSFLDKEIRQNLSKDDELYATTMEVENLSLIWEGKYTKAIENYKTLKERYSKNTQIVKHALFNLGYLYYFQLADSTKGEEYFAELKDKYPDDELTQQSRMLLKR